VGRSEILWPDLERQLRAARAADTLNHYAADKFRMAYQDFLYPESDGGVLSLRPDPPFAGAAHPDRRAAPLRFGWKASMSRDALGRFAP
jgi:hypothetical protein